MRRNFCIYLVFLSICLLTSITILLSGHHLKSIHATNNWFFKTIAQSQFADDLILDDYNGTATERKVLTEAEPVFTPPPFTVIDFDLNSGTLGMNIPPKASDVALILDELRSANITHLHLTTQFHREKNEGKLNSIVQDVFSNKNDPALENVLIPLEFTRAAKGSHFPSYLNNSSIPLDSIHGDIKSIPRVNKIIYSPYDGVNFQANDPIPSCMKFGFANLEAEDQPEGSVFLLARWDDRIIFNQLLLSTMVLHDVKPSDLTITMERKIDLGKGKPQLPIDLFGCSPLSDHQLHQTKAVSIDLLVLEEDKQKALKNAKKHALIVSSPTDGYSIQLIESPQSKVAQLYQAPLFDTVASFRRLPSWLEACILVEFTLICAYLYALTGSSRHLGYALLLVSALPCAVLLQFTCGYWLPITPVISLILIGWILSISMSAKWKLRRPTTKLTQEQKKELGRFT